MACVGVDLGGCWTPACGVGLAILVSRGRIFERLGEVLGGWARRVEFFVCLICEIILHQSGMKWEFTFETTSSARYNLSLALTVYGRLGSHCFREFPAKLAQQHGQHHFLRLKTIWRKTTWQSQLELTVSDGSVVFHFAR